MDERSSFDSLVSDLSPDERKDMLEKMQGIGGDPEQESLASPEPQEEGVSFATQIKNESLLVRFWLWLKSVLTNTSVEQLFNERRIGLLARTIERKTPGLLDEKKRQLLTLFFSKVTDLKKNADFFKPYCLAVDNNEGDFYVVLGSLAMPQAEQQLAEEVDPYSQPIDRGVKPELRVSLIRRMDEVMSSISADQKTLMFACARAADWLVQFSKLPFNHLLSQFSSAGETFICPFRLVADEIKTFARVLCNGVVIPSEVFQALYLFYRSRDSRTIAESGVQHASAEAFIEMAHAQLALMHAFIASVPMRSVGAVVRNDAFWSPEKLGGVEEWFVKYKLGWKKRFDQKWESWVNDCKKEVVRQRLQKDFDLDSFPLLEQRPWIGSWSGIKFRYELTAGFLTWYFRNCFSSFELTLKTLMTEGDFMKKENRAEFTEVFNEYVQISVGLNTFANATGGGSELAALFSKLEHEHTLQLVQKAEQVIRSLESDFAHILYRFGENSRKMNLLMEGIVGMSTDSRYDSIANYSTIQGAGNAVFRKQLKNAQISLANAYDMIKELEPVDMPSAPK